MHKGVEMNRSNTWKFWGTLLWGIVIGLVLLLGQLLPLVGYMLMTGVEFTLETFLDFMQNVEKDALLLSVSVIGSVIIVVPTVFGIAKLKKGATLKDYFDLNAYSWRTFWIWMGILLLLLIFETYTLKFLGVAETPSFMQNIEYPTASSIWLLVFSVMFMAPLIEEVIFRGFLLKGFSNSFMGTSGAIVITSLLWAMLHLQYSIEYMFVIFVIGLVFGYAKVKTHSLFVPMTMHMIMNGLAAVGLFIEKGAVG